MTSEGWLVYAIGLDPLVARAVYADLDGASIRRRRPLAHGGPRARAGGKPDLVLLDSDLAGVEHELAAARAAWGDDLLIVGVGCTNPLAQVWQSGRPAEGLEIGPGFLSALLAAAAPARAQCMSMPANAPSARYGP